MNNVILLIVSNFAAMRLTRNRDKDIDRTLCQPGLNAMGRFASNASNKRRVIDDTIECGHSCGSYVASCAAVWVQVTRAEL